jgi:hypothetical protein
LHKDEQINHTSQFAQLQKDILQVSKHGSKVITERTTQLQAKLEAFIEERDDVRRQWKIVRSLTFPEMKQRHSDIVTAYQTR